jgi:hypothetical protein
MANTHTRGHSHLPFGAVPGQVTDAFPLLRRTIIMSTSSGRVSGLTFLRVRWSTRFRSSERSVLWFYGFVIPTPELYLAQAESKLSRSPPKTSCSTWLPYTLIDQVLAAAAGQDELSPRGQVLQRELELEISNRVKRMQKISRLSQ